MRSRRSCAWRWPIPCGAVPHRRHARHVHARRLHDRRRRHHDRFVPPRDRRRRGLRRRLRRPRDGLAGKSRSRTCGARSDARGVEPRTSRRRRASPTCPSRRARSAPGQSRRTYVVHGARPRLPDAHDLQPRCPGAGLRPAAAVWHAMARTDLAVVDPFIVPRRANWELRGAVRPSRLTRLLPRGQGASIPSASTCGTRRPGTTRVDGDRRPLGHARRRWRASGHRRPRLAPRFGDRARPTIYYFAVAPGRGSRGRGRGARVGVPRQRHGGRLVAEAARRRDRAPA